MAVHVKGILFNRLSKILFNVALDKQSLGSKTSYRVLFNQFSPLKHSSLLSNNFPKNSNRKYSSKEDNNKKISLKLMDFQERIWPHPLKAIRNKFFSFIVRSYFDHDFSTQEFLKGAEQAMVVVSSLISSGKFKMLSKNKYTTSDIIPEIQYNYNLLTQAQRQFIAVNAEDIFLKFIYEIEERYVEITAAFQGLHGLAESQRESENLSFQDYMAESSEKLYVTNYRFIREYTKGKDDVWVINKLNHFSPKEVVEKTGIFDR